MPKSPLLVEFLGRIGKIEDDPLFLTLAASAQGSFLDFYPNSLLALEGVHVPNVSTYYQPAYLAPANASNIQASIYIATVRPLFVSQPVVFVPQASGQCKVPSSSGFCGWA